MGSARRRTVVRVERVDTACGCTGHMTVDQIKERSVGEHLNVSCPECGRIHLTIEDAEESSEKMHSRSNRYQSIMDQALGNAALEGGARHVTRRE